jgi:hypothetical protein
MQDGSSARWSPGRKRGISDCAFPRENGSCLSFKEKPRKEFLDGQNFSSNKEMPVLVATGQAHHKTLPVRVWRLVQPAGTGRVVHRRIAWI